MGDLYNGPCEAGCQHYHGGEVRHTPGCGHYPESLTKAFEDRIEALEAENARLKKALILIRDHRSKCHAYDENVGDDPREFDVEDVKLMDQAARVALKEDKA